MKLAVRWYNYHYKLKKQLYIYDQLFVGFIGKKNF